MTTMSAAESSSHDGMTAQVLIEIGKLQTNQAVANTKLDAVLANTSDHELRLRAIEQEQAKDTGGRDVWARVVAVLATLASIAAAVGFFIHK